MKLVYGAWEPDVAGVNAKDAAGAVTMEIARNVYPSREGWGPIPSLQPVQTARLSPRVFQPNVYQNSVFQTKLTGDSAVGLFVAKQKTGGWIIFAGTRTKLYKYNPGTAAWDDYSRVSGGAYSVPEEHFWSFIQFGSFVIAVNLANEPQVINIDSGATAFTNLAGSPPKAKYAAVVGGFVFLAHLDSNPRMVQNSAINDATGWTIGNGLCDLQEFPDGENVTGIIGGEFGWILQESAIRRCIFQPGFDQAFRFERVEKERGAVSPYSVIGVRDTAFFLATDGFYMFGPGGLRPIGHQRVNNWFVANSDPTRVSSVMGVSDQTGPRVFWAFYNTPSSETFDRLIIYDWDQDRWCYSDAAAQVWARVVTPAVTLESLNVYGALENVPFSLDSPFLEGGTPKVGAISTGGTLAFLQGAPMAATLTTSPQQLAPSGRANVGAVYPMGVFNGASIGIRVGKRENTQLPTTYTVSFVPSARTGIGWCKASGRVHNVELSLSPQSAGNDWVFAQGVDLAVSGDGRL